MIKTIFEKGVFTIPIFLLAFYLSVSDIYFSSFFQKLIDTLNNWSFFILYLMYIYFVYILYKGLIKMSHTLVILRTDKNKIKKILRLFFIAYFLGAIVNLGNELIIEIFNRFMFNGVSYVF